MNFSQQFTNRESRSIDRYLHEIGKFELLDVDEEIELVKKIRNSGGIYQQRAIEKLVTANLRFVVSVAKQYQNQGIFLGDLINEGNIGLMKAALRFDETRGFKFISYAVWWIRQSILQALAEQSRIVRLPLNRVGTLNKIGKAMGKLTQEFEREPTPEEIAEVIDESIVDVISTKEAAQKHASIDAPLGNGGEGNIADLIPNTNQPATDENLMRESLKTDIQLALNTLNPRDREVIQLYYGLEQEKPLTLEEIGDMLKLTRERVRQIKEKGIRKLKHASRSKVLKSYLG